MSLDTSRYAMLGDLEHPPCCIDCETHLIRLAEGVWICPNLDCDATDETDVQLDDRLQSAAESAFERVQSTNLGGGSLLSPDAMQRGLKR